MVYFVELHAAVKKYLQRFLKSCVFYFVRNTKGEMTVQYLHSKAIKCVLLIKRINQEIIIFVLNRDHC